MQRIEGEKRKVTPPRELIENGIRALRRSKIDIKRFSDKCLIGKLAREVGEFEGNSESAFVDIFNAKRRGIITREEAKNYRDKLSSLGRSVLGLIEDAEKKCKCVRR